MREHLEVSVAGIEDRREVDRLETEVLLLLDPPLNLQKMPPTDVRKRVSELRSLLSRRFG